MNENVKVEENTLVEIAYTLQLEDGTKVELPGQPSPLRFTYGTNHVLSGLQEALRGMHPTEEREVALNAADAYGEKQSEETIKLKREVLPDTLTLYPGRRVPLRSRSDGSKAVYYISNVEPEYVELEDAHPLAGLDLHFAVTVLDVVPAP